jgi:hypothetical protein
VQPGQSGKVPLQLTAAHAGHLSKAVTVFTNAPKPEAMVTLKIEGEVWDPVAFEPQSVNFGRLTAESEGGTGLFQRVTITNNMDSPAELSDIRSTSPLFQVEAKTLESGKKFELLVTVVSPLNPGNTNARLELATGLPETPNLSIPISAYVVPDVELSPETVRLPAARSAGRKRQITVRNNTRLPLNISNLAVSNPDLQVTLTETQPGAVYIITLNVPAGAQLSPTGDKITFETDHPTAPHIEVPVTEVKAGARSVATKPASSQASQPTAEQSAEQPD